MNFSVLFLQLANTNPLHSSSIALSNQQLSLATTASSTSAIEPATIQMSSNSHSPKSPSQMTNVQHALHNTQTSTVIPQSSTFRFV